MEQYNDVKNVGLIYFSGTGGTKRIAEAFEKELTRRGILVSVKNLGASIREKMDAPETQEQKEMDLNILLFPVYAMNAPRLVYDWIESTAGSAAGRRIAVISVSGGGEMWPNTGCRYECCKALENSGFHVIYDRMMVMPANIFISYNDHLIMQLIHAIPEKVTLIIDDLLAGKAHRTRVKPGPLSRWVSRLEMKNAGKFPRRFKVSDECTSCGWCMQNCPAQNINIPEPGAKPEFFDRCISCIRCVYGCPAHAIKTPWTLKNGFDLDETERRMKGVEPESPEKYCRGWIYKGVKDYLQNKY